jgi:hypothetical protein
MCERNARTPTVGLGFAIAKPKPTRKHHSDEVDVMRGATNSMSANARIPLLGRDSVRKNSGHFGRERDLSFFANWTLNCFYAGVRKS